MSELRSHIVGHTIEDNGNGTITIKGKCVFTKEDHSATIPKEGWLSFRQGIMIQVALPTVSDDDREFVLSGISPKGWDKAFGNVKDVADE